MNFRTIVCLGTLLSLQALAVSAQEKAVSAPITKHTCAPPGEAPGKLASASQIKNHRKELVEFRTCLTAYAEQLRGEAQKRILAANAAVEEYNQYVAKIKGDDGDKQ